MNPNHDADRRLTWLVQGALGMLVVGSVYFIARRPTPPPIIISPITPPAPLMVAPASTPGPISVYVCGEVVHPGVFTIPRDSRIADAIASAGGATANADLIRINLAQRLEDGQQVYVPSHDEQATPILPTPAAARPPFAQAPAANCVNINTAGLAELDTLPGIGTVLAQRILDYRQMHGAFGSTSDLKRVSGIGDSTFAKLAPQICVQ